MVPGPGGMGAADGMRGLVPGERNAALIGMKNSAFILKYNLVGSDITLQRIMMA